MKMKIDTLLEQVGFQPESEFWLQMDEKFRGEYQEFLNMQKSDTFSEKDIKEKDQKLYDFFNLKYDVEDMTKSEKAFKEEHKEDVPEKEESTEKTTETIEVKKVVEEKEQSTVDSKQEKEQIDEVIDQKSPATEQKTELKDKKDQKPPVIEQKTEVELGAGAVFAGEVTHVSEQKLHVIEQEEEGLKIDKNGIATLTKKDQKKTKKEIEKRSLSEVEVPTPENENTNVAEEKKIKTEKEKVMEKEEKQPEIKGKTEETPEEIIERIKNENPETKVEEVPTVVEAEQVTTVVEETVVEVPPPPPADEYPELTAYLESNTKINSKELVKLGFPREKWNEDTHKFEHGKYTCQKTGPWDLMFNSWTIYAKTDTSV